MSLNGTCLQSTVYTRFSPWVKWESTKAEGVPCCVIMKTTVERDSTALTISQRSSKACIPGTVQRSLRESKHPGDSANPLALGCEWQAPCPQPRTHDKGQTFSASSTNRGTLPLWFREPIWERQKWPGFHRPGGAFFSDSTFCGNPSVQDEKEHTKSIITHASSSGCLLPLSPILKLISYFPKINILSLAI